MKITSFPSAGVPRAGMQRQINPSAWGLCFKLAAAVTLAWTAFQTELQASDPIGVYAFVDKVVFEPSTGTPERIQVWGGFAIAEGRGYDYAPAKRGFLYLQAGSEGDATLARNEWNDLKSVAGTGQIVSFGSRYKPLPTVRDAKADVKNPDRYPIGFGLTKVRTDRGRTADYKPFKELRALQEKEKTSTSSSPPDKAASPAKKQE